MRVLFRHCGWSMFRPRELRRYSQESAIEKPKKFENLLIDSSNGIATISINRPSSRNSLDCATLRELTTALAAYDGDPDTRALVVAGEGGNLSSGFDLFELNRVGYNAMMDAARALLRRPLTVKPTVCAVSGYAVGAGLGLALACDLRVIEDTAVLGFLGRRFGVPQSLDGGARLASLVGLSRALDLTLTGRLIPGTTAHDWGLAARFVATGTGIGQAVNLSMSLVKFPQAAMLRDKLATVNSQLGADDGPDRERNEAAALALQAAVADEMRDGVDKFEKGIGRHGKFYGLTLRQVKHWEHEDDDKLV